MHDGCHIRLAVFLKQRVQRRAESDARRVETIKGIDVRPVATLFCETNNLSGLLAFATARQLTAVMVGSATVSEF